MVADVRGIVTQLRLAEAPPELMDTFQPLGTWPFARTAREVLMLEHGSSNPSDFFMRPEALTSIGRAFHVRAGTLTPKVAESLDAMASGRQLIRVGHQPNFAAYLKLGSLFIAAEEAAAMIQVVPIYIINDCDVISNETFMRTILPDVTHPRGGVYLSVPLGGKASSSVNFQSSLPAYDWLRSTIGLIRENARGEMKITRQAEIPSQRSITDIVDDLEFSWHNARTLSEMTSIFLSRMVNIRFGLGTIFLSGHVLWNNVGPIVSAVLMERWTEVVRVQKQIALTIKEMSPYFNLTWLTDEKLVPLWWVCHCTSRVRLRFRDDNMIFGTCGRCGREIRLPADEVPYEAGLGRLAPRVGALDFAEAMAPELRAGVTYMSSARHGLVYALLAHEMGVKPLPQVVIDIRGNFGTPIEMMLKLRGVPKAAIGFDRAIELISGGRASSVYYATRSDTAALSQSIRRWIRFGELDDELTVQ
jgi:hypothetical protein